ncbi:hypothetical protein RUM43_011485 [Polyplax serrata]|uniref:Uncharacterized protein n=1 Tax=Polyplax serrata TaxID=468196 RepID=A0AAN8NT42_POLSC
MEPMTELPAIASDPSPTESPIPDSFSEAKCGSGKVVRFRPKSLVRCRRTKHKEPNWDMKEEVPDGGPSPNTWFYTGWSLAEKKENIFSTS